jgi:hypothetical protein
MARAQWDDAGTSVPRTFGSPSANEQFAGPHQQRELGQSGGRLTRRCGYFGLSQSLQRR